MLTNGIQRYWLATCQGVYAPEHVIFKKGTPAYTPALYDQPKKLPPSFAALGAFCFGVFGVIMGMSQFGSAGSVGEAVGGLSRDEGGVELASAFPF